MFHVLAKIRMNPHRFSGQGDFRKIGGKGGFGKSILIS